MKRKSLFNHSLALATLCLVTTKAQSARTELLVQSKPELELAELPAENGLFAAADLANVGTGSTLNSTAFTPNPASEPIIIDTGKLSPTKLNEAREDMKIMEQLLLEVAGSTAQRRIIASGIALMNYLEESNHRNIFIAGTGAIFFLNVDFPLTGKVEEKKVKKAYPKDSAWERARRKVAAKHSAEPVLPSQGLEVYPNFPPQKATHFHPEKVRILKEQLGDALASATNMRALDPNDKIWVVVTGPSETTPRNATAHAPRLSITPAQVYMLNSTPSSTRLTIMASKTDIDELSAGNLTLKNFLDRVGLQIR